MEALTQWVSCLFGDSAVLSGKKQKARAGLDSLGNDRWKSRKTRYNSEIFPLRVPSQLMRHYRERPNSRAPLSSTQNSGEPKKHARLRSPAFTTTPPPFLGDAGRCWSPPAAAPPVRGGMLGEEL